MTMNIPNELWHLIIEFSNIDIYKKCLLIDKRIYQITKRFINNLPNKIKIILSYSNDNIICVKDHHHPSHICEFINQNNNKGKWIDRKALKSTYPICLKNNCNDPHLERFSGFTIISQRFKLAPIFARYDEIIIDKHDMLISRKVKPNKYISNIPLPKIIKEIITIKFRWIYFNEFEHKLLLCYE